MKIPPSHPKGSSIWKLLQASLPVIKSKLTWIPGNGKLISIWNDSILKKSPLSQDESLRLIKDWLAHQNKFTKYDISIWNVLRSWSGWNLGDLPLDIQDQAEKLLYTLQGLSPWHIEDQDERGWGEQGYLVSRGYESLLHQSVLLVKSPL